MDSRLTGWGRTGAALNWVYMACLHLSHLRDGTELDLQEKDFQCLQFNRAEKGRAVHVSAFIIAR